MRCISATSVTNCLFEAATNERQTEREAEDTRDGAYITWESNVTALKLLRQYPVCPYGKCKLGRKQSVGKQRR